MLFEEVLPHLRAGKKIYRTSWKNPDYYLSFENNKVILHLNNTSTMNWCVAYPDVLADDWGIKE